MKARGPYPIALVVLIACSGADRTALEADGPLAGDEANTAAPSATRFAPATRASDGLDVAAETALGAARPAVEHERTRARAVAVAAPAAAAPELAGDAAGAADAGGRPEPLPCSLRLEWRPLAASHDACQPLSGLPAAELAVWDGAQLSLLGATWTVEDGRLERTRRCQHQGGQLWRFAELLALAENLPAESCPASAVEATYTYDECPLLSPGTVCAAGEPSACQLTGTLRLTPVRGAPPAEALAAPELEQSCRPVGRDPRRPVPTGERCYDGECEAGHFCSRELGDDTCAPLGEGVCTPAPTSFDCGTASEDLCLCTDPPLPLRELPPFDAARAGALVPNTCAAHALGLSVSACPESD